MRGEKFIFGWFKGLGCSLIIATSFLTASCGSTAAQRQMGIIQENAQVAKERLSSCQQRLEASPAYAIVRNHGPLAWGHADPTAAQLADNNYATPKEIQAIIALDEMAQPCLAQTINDAMGVCPTAVPIMTKELHATDLVMADLIQRKITFGEANKKLLALSDEFMPKLMEAQRHQINAIAASHEAELSQRRAAVAALIQFLDERAARIQAMEQNQQLINAVNRPRQTRCWWNGNQIECTSY